ncbi:MAG: hypothetical protein WCJ71_02665 [Candidatus Omnitrophota bacterium]
MKKILGMLMAVVFFGMMLGVVNLYAEEATDTMETNLKEELSADKEAVVAQHETMKTNSQTAKSEEATLKAQIKEAKLAGDKEKAKELKAQLKATHQENVKQRTGDKETLKVAKKEVKADKKQLHQERKAVHTERRAQKKQ